MSESAARQWTLVLVLTALFLSLVVLGQIVARYGAAYRAAPREIVALLDSADSSLQENESYDRDVAKVARLDDKMRLGRLLREIQRAGDDLREDLNAVLERTPSLLEKPRSPRRRPATTETPPSPPPSPLPASLSSSISSTSSTSTRLTTTARLLWAAKRTHLEERLRRLDLLRMRFLVVYMSIVAASATAAAEKVEKTAHATHATHATHSVHAVHAVHATTTAFVASPPLSSASSAGLPSLPSSPRVRNSKMASLEAASGLLSSDDDEYDEYLRSEMDARLRRRSLLRAHTLPPGPPPPPPLPPSLPPAPPPTPRSPHMPRTPRTPRTPQAPQAPQTPQTLQMLSMPPAFPFDLLESIRNKPPLRRVSTLPPRARDTPEGHHRAGWMGVVQELQRSPLLHKRHTFVETAAKNEAAKEKEAKEAKEVKEAERAEEAKAKARPEETVLR